MRIEAAGLCHSDLSVVNGTRPRPVPMALGHEGAGVVEAVGQGVHDLAVGDRVVTVFVPSCGTCPPCAEGRPALCEPGAAANGAGTLVGGNVRLHRADGTPVHHHLGVSCFAEQAVVHRNSLVKVDPSLAPEQAALFGCAVLTGVGAVVNTASVKAGESVAVVGLGGVGLASVLGAVASGRAQDRRPRPRSRQARPRPRTRRHGCVRRRRPRGRPAGVARRRAAGSIRPSRWLAPFRPSSSPTPSPAAAARRPRRASPTRPHHGPPAPLARRRGAHAARELHRRCRPGARRAAIHRAVPARAAPPSTACCRQCARSRRSTRRWTTCTTATSSGRCSSRERADGSPA